MHEDLGKKEERMHVSLSPFVICLDAILHGMFFVY